MNIEFDGTTAEGIRCANVPLVRVRLLDGTEVDLCDVHYTEWFLRMGEGKGMTIIHTYPPEEMVGGEEQQAG